jgi:osmoprotectant transport system ATP-binding protein
MIQVEGLVRRFGAAVVVDGVSFRVEKGELLALVGASGCGKTTTLKMINRLVEPTAGRVWVDGEDAALVEPHVLRRRIGYVFQGVGLFPHMTVEENVALPLVLVGREGRETRTRVAEVLGLVELDPALGKRLPAGLSGGQQQRVGVARALVASPRVMLLDEPFGALDPITRDRLQQAFLQLRRKLGLTGVLVTHDMAEALLLADRVGVMRAGRIVQIGAPAELLRAPSDPFVSEMLESPLRQARFLQALGGGVA